GVVGEQRGGQPRRAARAQSDPDLWRALRHPREEPPGQRQPGDDRAQRGRRGVARRAPPHPGGAVQLRRVLGQHRSGAPAGRAATPEPAASRSHPGGLEMTTTDAPLLGLSLRSGSERVWSFLLEEGKTVAIGRSDGCEVVLSSPGISRRHALITRKGDKLVLSDHSHNGTLLDRSWLKRSARVLPDASAKLTVGPFELELRVEKVPPQRIAPPQAPAATALPAPPAPAQPAAAGERAAVTEVEAERRLAELRRRIHRRLLDHLELPKLDFQQVPSDELRSKVLAGLWRIVGELHAELGADIDRDRLVQQ